MVPVVNALVYFEMLFLLDHIVKKPDYVAEVVNHSHRHAVALILKTDDFMAPSLFDEAFHKVIRPAEPLAEKGYLVVLDKDVGFSVKEHSRRRVVLAVITFALFRKNGSGKRDYSCIMKVFRQDGREFSPVTQFVIALERGYRTGA